MRHAKLPLDADAVAAADKALYLAHPELKGRKLTMDAADGALRQEWMDSYIASGGGVPPLKTKAPPKTAVVPCPPGTLTEKEAQGMFEELKKTSVIPFNYPVDCCYSRAHAMCRIMESQGVACGKVWLFSKDWPASGDLKPVTKAGTPVTFPDDTGTRQPVEWGYHVAPTVKVVKSDGTVEERVMDPSLADKPITVDEWRKIQGNPAGSYTEESDSSPYFQNKKHGYLQEDATGKETKKQMEDHRNTRDDCLAKEKAKTTP